MVVDEHGEKWACDACVRGHRVSNCNHIGRPLHHINRKGRPVSQCPHCRGLRKPRGVHVKCKCQDKHGKDDARRPEKDGGMKPDASCYCLHGGRCTCALRKDSRQPSTTTATANILSDLTGQPMNSTAGIDEGIACRIPTVQSDNSLSTLACRVRHGPVRHEATHNNMGLPYQIPRSRSHGYAEQQPSEGQLKGHQSNRIIQALDPVSVAQQQDRLSKSEHNTPHSKPIAILDRLDTHLAPLDLPNSNFNFGSLQYPNDSIFDQRLTTDPYDHPLWSAPIDAPPFDWSNIGMHETGMSYSQTPSFANFDLNQYGVPGLSTSSSGDVSETEESRTVSDFAQTATEPTNQISIDNSAPSAPPINPSPQDWYGLNPLADISDHGQYPAVDIDELLEVITNNATASKPAAAQQLLSSQRHSVSVQDIQRLAHSGDASADTPGCCNDNCNNCGNGANYGYPQAANISPGNIQYLTNSDNDPVLCPYDESGNINVTINNMNQMAHGDAPPNASSSWPSQEYARENNQMMSFSNCEHL